MQPHNADCQLVCHFKQHFVGQLKKQAHFKFFRKTCVTSKLNKCSDFKEHKASKNH